jgi:hypothetical protein
MSTIQKNQICGYLSYAVDQKFIDKGYKSVLTSGFNSAANGDGYDEICDYYQMLLDLKRSGELTDKISSTFGKVRIVDVQLHYNRGPRTFNA